MLFTTCYAPPFKKVEFSELQVTWPLMSSPERDSLRVDWLDVVRRIKYVQMHCAHLFAISLIVLIPVIVSWKFLRVLALLSKMPARCIVAGYSNTTKDGVSLHVFPKDENLRRIWTSKVKLTRGNWKSPSDTSVICSAHFEDSDFDHGLYSLLSLKKLRRLKPDAVPIIKSNVVR